MHAATASLPYPLDRTLILPLIDAPLTPQAICPSGSRSQSLSVRAQPPGPGDPLAITNSFGMPSQSPQQLREDIPRARAALHRGQMMVVSVTGGEGTREARGPVRGPALCRLLGLPVW